MTNYNDGAWHGWNGGECPVHPKSVVDAVWHDEKWQKSGIFHNCQAIGEEWSLPWPHVVKFRVVKAYREPREFWIAGRNDLAFPSARDAKIAFPGCTPIHVREVTE